MAQYTLLSGELATFRSSAPVVRSFCAICGTPLAYQHADAPDAIELTTATLDDPERFPPTREIWHLQKVSWAAPNPALVHYGRDSQGESDSVS